jgi:hypothetical protein
MTAKVPQEASSPCPLMLIQKIQASMPSDLYCSDIYVGSVLVAEVGCSSPPLHCWRSAWSGAAARVKSRRGTAKGASAVLAQCPALPPPAGAGGSCAREGTY